MKYAAYELYKPSKIEWIGAVPEHWEIWKIAHGFQMTGSGTTPPPDNPDWYDGNVCWVTTSELRETVITDTEKKISQEALKNFSALKVFPEGALAIAMYGATIGRLGIFGIAAATNQACAVLFGQKAFDTKFVFYWLQAFREQIILLASGGGQPNISQEKVRSVRIACPSIDEQQTIARFLDAKSAQIDALVAQKRQLIAKLKEKRSALIARTVTRGLPPEAAKAAGLEPNPEMKDSGIPWIGNIPASWKVKRLKHISDRITVGVVVNPSSYVADEGVPFLLGGDVREFKIDISSCNRCSDEASRGPLAKSRLVAGDLLVVRVGYPGIAAVVSPEIEGANCASMMIVGGSDRFNSQWLAYAINAKSGRDQVELVQYGAAQKQFNISHAVDFSFPFPPIKEQLAIADYLDHECARLDRLTKEVENAISRLTEYRQALITSAVTGKIDVRSFQDDK